MIKKGIKKSIQKRHTAVLGFSTDPASLEKNPVMPARVFPVGGGSVTSGTAALYTLKNSSLTSPSLWPRNNLQLAPDLLVG